MNSAARKQPVSSHPAFRWAVGAWFAALLGGGLFVMPDAVHDQLRQSIGIAALFPAGTPGKLALSGGAALLGLVLGLVIGMRVAALNDVTHNGYDEDEEVEPDAVWLTDEPVFDEIEPETGVEEAVDEDPRRPFNPREYIAEEASEVDPNGDVIELDAEAEPDAGPEPYFSDSVEYLAPDEANQPSQILEDAIEWLPEQESAIEAAEPVFVAQPTPLPTSEEKRAFGDLSLTELTARLNRAIKDREAVEAAGSAGEGEDMDPVIAFLRREADRSSTTLDEGTAAEDDPQAALRGALDRLSRISNPR